MSSSAEDVDGNYGHKNITECMNECKSALNEVSNKVDLREMCMKFQSDYVSMNNFNESGVKDFVKKLNVIKVDDILTVIDKNVDIRDVEDSQNCDSMCSCGKIFKVERFFYCRVYNGNDCQVEVVMIWVYLEAHLQHQATIRRRLNEVFDVISDQAYKIVGRATLQKIADKTVLTTNSTYDDLIKRHQLDGIPCKILFNAMAIGIWVLVVSFYLLRT